MTLAKASKPLGDGSCRFLPSACAAALLSASLTAAASPRERVTVLAKVQSHALQVTESHALAVPRHHAGRYVEWVNERAFLARRNLVEGATYRVMARVVRTEVRRFPEGWGVRSGQAYSVDYLRADSAAIIPRLKETSP